MLSDNQSILIAVGAIPICLRIIESLIKKVWESEDKKLIREIHAVCSRTTEDGVPKCYIPHSICTDVKGIQTVLADIAKGQDKIIIILEMNNKV